MYRLNIRSPWGRMLGFVVFVAMLIAVPGWGADLGDEEGTWPPISTNLTTRDGWVWVYGQAEGGGGIAWRTRLTRSGESAKIEHGAATSWVSVGDRNFIIDNATGRAVEMRQGQVWRRIPPGGPDQLRDETPPPTTQSYEGQTPTEDLPRDMFSGEFPEEQQRRLLSPPTELSVAPQRLQEHQDVLEQQVANVTELAGAIQQLRQASRLQMQDGSTADRMVMQAREDVEGARRRLHDTHRRILQHWNTLAASGLIAVSPSEQSLAASRDRFERGEISPADRRRVNELQQLQTMLNTLLNEAVLDIEDLRAAGADQEQINQAQQRIKQVEDRLAKVQEQLRAMNEGMYEVARDRMSPDMRNRIGQVEREVIDLENELAEAEQNLLAVQRQQREGQADQAAVNRAMGNVLSVMRKLDSAKQELADLRNNALDMCTAGADESDGPEPETMRQPSTQDSR